MRVMPRTSVQTPKGVRVDDSKTSPQSLFIDTSFVSTFQRHLTQAPASHSLLSNIYSCDYPTTFPIQTLRRAWAMFTTGSTAAVQSTGAGLLAGLGRCQARAATSRVLCSLVSHRHASTSAASCASSHRSTQRASKKLMASGSLCLRREHDLGAGRGLTRTFCSSVSRKQQDGRAHPNLQSYQRLRDHQHQQSLCVLYSSALNTTS